MIQRDCIVKPKRPAQPIDDLFQTRVRMLRGAAIGVLISAPLWMIVAVLAMMFLEIAGKL